jgi:transposase
VGADDRVTDLGQPSVLRRLNELLRDRGFDDFAEVRGATFYAATMGRPGLAPGIYFRLLLIGYFEGLDSERAIAWRAADSLTLRDFLGLAFPDAPPDHSTISRTRRLIVSKRIGTCSPGCWSDSARPAWSKARTIAIDATTLEANAALRHIVRRDTGEGYQEFLTTLAQASGIETPTNTDWTSPSDPDAKIAKMKDGRTHLAHKAEHPVDLDTGAIVAVTIQGADEGDTYTLPETLAEAVEQLDHVTDADGEPVALAHGVVADKGCHSRAVLLELTTHGFRTYISEPDRGEQSWRDQEDARDAVYGIVAASEVTAASGY